GICGGPPGVVREAVGSEGGQRERRQRADGARAPDAKPGEGERGDEEDDRDRAQSPACPPVVDEELRAVDRDEEPGGQGEGRALRVPTLEPRPRSRVRRERERERDREQEGRDRDPAVAEARRGQDGRGEVTGSEAVEPAPGVGDVAEV